MKRVIILIAVTLVVFVSCKNGGDGQLVGVKDRPDVLELEPYGMVYVPSAHYVMGGGDQDVPFAQTQQCSPSPTAPKSKLSLHHKQPHQI